jgi:hypothetical protein
VSVISMAGDREQLVVDVWLVKSRVEFDFEFCATLRSLYASSRLVKFMILTWDRFRRRSVVFYLFIRLLPGTLAHVVLSAE